MYKFHSQKSKDVEVDLIRTVVADESVCGSEFSIHDDQQTNDELVASTIATDSRQSDKV
jgi:hypothetical protein